MSALLGLSAVLGLSAGQPAAPAPNIQFVLTDDMKASDLEYMPSTQNLLAKEGVKFTKGWVTRSLCCPSRADLEAGRTEDLRERGRLCDVMQEGGSQS